MDLWHLKPPSCVATECDPSDHMLGPPAVWTALDGGEDSLDCADRISATIMVQRRAPTFCT